MEEINDEELSIDQLKSIIYNDYQKYDARKENLIVILTRKYMENSNFDEIVGFLTNLSQYFIILPKSKTAKIIRLIIDEVCNINDNYDKQIDIVKLYINWCNNEKRTFLRQRMEFKLSILYYKIKKYNESINLLSSLIYEIKKLDDKQLLVEISLFESQLYYSINNIPKSKSSLTTARSISSSIYVSPLIQADIDLQAGILQTIDGDYRTGLSYFIEAFESYDQLNNKNAYISLQYLLLNKILNGQSNEIPSLCKTKYSVKYNGIMLEAMRELAICYTKRSLLDFRDVAIKYQSILTKDKLLSLQMNTFENELINQSLLRIVEPYNCIETTEISNRIKLPLELIENKITQLILDKKLNGILDKTYLIIYDDEENSNIFDSLKVVVAELSPLLESLQEKSSKLR